MSRLWSSIRRRRAAPEATPPASAAPAGTDPGQAPPAKPGFRERGQLRRRLRFLTVRREILLRDLGGFVFDLQRFAQTPPPENELAREKLERLAATDAELRTVAASLGREQTLTDIREAGVGGECGRCGALQASEARYCWHCGVDLASPEGRGLPAPVADVESAAGQPEPRPSPPPPGPLGAPGSDADAPTRAVPAADANGASGEDVPSAGTEHGEPLERQEDRPG